MAPFSKGGSGLWPTPPITVLKDLEISPALTVGVGTHKHVAHENTAACLCPQTQVWAHLYRRESTQQHEKGGILQMRELLWHTISLGAAPRLVPGDV